MAKKRAMNAIKQADVIVTNPTHVAVALRYVAAWRNDTLLFIVAGIAIVSIGLATVLRLMPAMRKEVLRMRGNTTSQLSARMPSPRLTSSKPLNINGIAACS